MDEFFLPPWLAVTLSGCAGSMMYSVVRPYREGWKTAVWSMMAGTALAGFATNGVCELLGVTSVSLHLLIGFGIGLLGIVICRAAVTFAEGHAMLIITEGFKRLFRIPDNPPNARDGDERRKPDEPET